MFSASPGSSSSFVIGNDSVPIVSVVWRLRPQTRLTQAEQSMPVVELPPQTYGMPSRLSALARISPVVTVGGPPARVTDWAGGAAGGSGVATGAGARVAAGTPSWGSDSRGTMLPTR